MFQEMRSYHFVIITLFVGTVQNGKCRARTNVLVAKWEGCQRAATMRTGENTSETCKKKKERKELKCITYQQQKDSF